MADETDISALLRALGSDAPVDDVRMPDDVWQRMAGVLAAESAARSQSMAHGQDPADELAARRSVKAGYSRRWATGLVAASAVVLAGVVLAGLVREEQPVPVAADLNAPAGLSSAGLLVPPAQVITNTNTDYTFQDMADQVSDLISRAGLDLDAEPVPRLEAAQAAPMAAVPEDGEARAMPVDPIAVPLVIAEPMQRLRDCVTKIAHSETATALVIDLSTFDGKPAGVMVMPESADTVVVHVVDADCVDTMHLLIPSR